MPAGATETDDANPSGIDQSSSAKLRNDALISINLI
jgi:hypothetical protein